MPTQEAGHEQRRAERLNLSGALFRSAEPAVIVVDARKRVTVFSRAAERIVGRVALESMGQSIAILPAPLQKVIEEAFASGQPVVDRLLMLFPDAEENTPVQVNAALCRDASEQPVGVVATLYDLGAVRGLERRIRRLERLASVGTLSAGVAHEIKNALVAIKSFAELLSQRNEEVEMTGLINREARRIDSLVSQLLKFAGPAKPVFSPTGVHEVLENSLRLVQHQIKTRKIELVRAFDAGIDAVRGDAKQLEQACINLLLNAVEAMGEAGTLTVATEIVVATEYLSHFELKTKRRQIQVTVRDTGSGIPPELISQLFIPFMTTKPEGTGLGLAIASRIIQEHRGRIKVESEVNKGTIFRVTLPLEKEG